MAERAIRHGCSGFFYLCQFHHKCVQFADYKLASGKRLCRYHYGELNAIERMRATIERTGGWEAYDSQA